MIWLTLYSNIFFRIIILVQPVSYIILLYLIVFSRHLLYSNFPSIQFMQTILCHCCIFKKTTRNAEVAAKSIQEKSSLATSPTREIPILNNCLGNYLNFNGYLSTHARNYTKICLHKNYYFCQLLVQNQ